MFISFLAKRNQTIRGISQLTPRRRRAVANILIFERVIWLGRRWVRLRIRVRTRLIHIIRELLSRLVMALFIVTRYRRFRSRLFPSMDSLLSFSITASILASRDAFFSIQTDSKISRCMAANVYEGVWKSDALKTGVYILLQDYYVFREFSKWDTFHLTAEAPYL